MIAVLRLGLSGRVPTPTLGTSVGEAASSLLSGIGVDPSGAWGFWLYRDPGSGLPTLKVSVPVDLGNLPDLSALRGARLDVGAGGREGEVRVASVSGVVLTPEGLPRGDRALIRLTTPAVPPDPRRPPSPLWILESAAETWAGIGVELRVPSSVRVVEQRVRAVSWPGGGRGYVGWFLARQDGGDSLGAAAAAAEAAGAGPGRREGFGCVELGGPIGRGAGRRRGTEAGQKGRGGATTG